MPDSAVAQPPATNDTTPEHVTQDDSSTQGKAFKIKEFKYGNAKVTLLGKEVTSKSGDAYTKRFFAVEHFYKTKEGDWKSDSYFDEGNLQHLGMAVADALRGYHDKTL